MFWEMAIRKKFRTPPEMLTPVYSVGRLRVSKKTGILDLEMSRSNSNRKLRSNGKDYDKALRDIITHRVRKSDTRLREVCYATLQTWYDEFPSVGARYCCSYLGALLLKLFSQPYNKKCGGMLSDKMQMQVSCRSQASLNETEMILCHYIAFFEKYGRFGVDWRNFPPSLLNLSFLSMSLFRSPGRPQSCNTAISTQIDYRMKRLFISSNLLYLTYPLTYMYCML